VGIKVNYKKHVEDCGGILAEVEALVLLSYCFVKVLIVYGFELAFSMAK